MSRREEYNRMTGKHLPEKDSMTLEQIYEWQREIERENQRLEYERKKKAKNTKQP